MADCILFNEGATSIWNTGLPSTLEWALSTKPCSGAGSHVVGDTHAGGFGEITGTGYARIAATEPTAVNRVLTFALASWNTGAATNWPASVKSIVLIDSSASKKIIGAVNLQAGGAARDLSAAGTTENVTPTLTMAGA
jgi:hypothetical protein